MMIIKDFLIDFEESYRCVEGWCYIPATSGGATINLIDYALDVAGTLILYYIPWRSGRLSRATKNKYEIENNKITLIDDEGEAEREYMESESRTIF